MNIEDLASIASAMVAPGKGILAADESTGTIKKRFDSVNAESTFENRRDYREMLFRARDSMSAFISGVILFDETIGQISADGTPLVRIIEDSGALVGIKVDRGAKPLAGSGDEKITEGLDGLRERLAAYHEQGARFAKWRAVIGISGDTLPSGYCVSTNVHALARYAALCQEAGMVPVVEPEVLMDGSHDIDRCYDVTEFTLKSLFDELYAQDVAPEGVILKSNMVVSGNRCHDRAGAAEVAEKTVRCLRACVPAAVPGVVFLSGGQSPVDATDHLNAMNAGFSDRAPWALSFSYGRALQETALEAWAGKAANIPAAQAAFAHRARMNGLARQGMWDPSLETRG